MEFDKENCEIILKAEIEHDEQHSVSSAKKLVNKRLNFAISFLNSDEKQMERIKVHNELQMCEKGKELETILSLLCLDNDRLSMIFMRIQRCLATELWPLGEVDIIAVGSSASGLAVRDSDIDIFIDTTQFRLKEFGKSPINIENVSNLLPRTSEHRIVFNRINNLLKNSTSFEDVYAIPWAKVPIITCVHRVTGFSIDINISCRSTVSNTQFVRELVQSDPRIRELLLFLKLWAKNMKIMRKSNMTSYCLFNLVVFYLQQPQGQESSGQQRGILKSILQLQQNCKPNITEGVNYAFDLQSPDNRPSIPPGCTTLQLIGGFFYFYKQFDFSTLIVSPFLGKAITKNEFTPDKFEVYKDQLADLIQFMDGVPAPTFRENSSMCVQDCFALTNNVAHTIVPATLKYFKLCLDKAYNTTCVEGKIRANSEILESLLYETPPLNTPNTTTERQLRSAHIYRLYRF